MAEMRGRGRSQHSPTSEKKSSFETDSLERCVEGKGGGDFFFSSRRRKGEVRSDSTTIILGGKIRGESEEREGRNLFLKRKRREKSVPRE